MSAEVFMLVVEGWKGNLRSWPRGVLSLRSRRSISGTFFLRCYPRRYPRFAPSLSKII